MAAPIQLFQDFYRMHGVRRIDTLPDLEVAQIKRLPRESALHILGDAASPHLDVSNPLLSEGDLVFFHNVTTYHPEHTGGSLRITDMRAQESAFTRKNPRYKYVPELQGITRANVNQLVVFNYGWLDQFHKYQDVRTTDFLRFDNKLWSVMNTISLANKIEPRNHFILLDIPDEVQPKSILDQQSQADITVLSRIFDTDGERILRHVWLFLNPNLRSTSVFGFLSPADLKTTNLIFRSNEGKYAIVNLAYLYSWVRGDENLTPISTLSTRGFEEVQKYYLKAMLTLQTLNMSGATMDQQLSGLEQKGDIAEGNEENQEAEEASGGEDRFQEDGVSNHTRPGKGSKSVKDTPRTSQEDPSQEIEPELDLKKMDAEIDEDLKALEIVSRTRMDKIEEAVKEADRAYVPESPLTQEQIAASLFTDVSTEDAAINKIQALAASGRISAPEMRKKIQLVTASAKKPDPYGSGKTIAQAMVVTKEDLALPKEQITMNVPATVIDKSMAVSSLPYMGRKYNTETLKKDTLAVVQHFQKAGVIIKNHDVDTVHSILGGYDDHVLELAPIQGMPSVIRARIPHVDEDGSFRAKNSKYALRSQIVDKPIRKIGATRVGLTSYYRKVFVDRAVKKADSYIAYICSRLSKATIQPDEYLRGVSPGNVFDNYFQAPYIYSALSEQFQGFQAGNLTIDLNPKKFRKTLDPRILEKVEVDGTVVAGYASGNRLVLIDKYSDFYVIGKEKREYVGNIYDILRLDQSNAPVDYAELKVFSSGIPLAAYFGIQVGWRQLVKLLGAKYRTVEGRKAKELKPWEYVVQFKDIAFIFDRREAKNTLILAGMNVFEKETKLYDASYFEESDIYTKLLASKGMSGLYVQEMENLRDMFVDPITLRILKEMGEPTTFNELMVRSCELLTTYYYPDSQDMDYQRVRGYERFAGFLYKELANAVRSQKSRNSTGRAKVDMSPYQVWSTLTRDPAVKHCEDINPIQSLKITQEAVTYVGEGGRAKESMNRESRAFTKSALGILSGDSVDSSDVGINSFLSADPEFSSLDGMKKKGVKIDPTNLLSTSVLLAPFATMDDMKRRGFIGIQQGHTIATAGAEAPMVRTGYESVVGMRSSNMFAQVALGEGVVTSVSDKGMLVKYKDGTEKGYPLGILFGRAEGSVYPNTLVTDLKVGDKVKKDDYLTYNTQFFQKDPILPGGIVYKGSLMARVALMETAHTHEDSSAISEGLSKRLMATVCQEKTYVVNFEQNVHNVVKVGQKLRPEDILMTIEDEISSTGTGLSAGSLDILAERSKNSPRSSYFATVSAVEVLYHGDKDDMSSSLKALADASDRIKSSEAKSRGTPVATGYVNSDLSIQGSPLAVNKAVIKIYLLVQNDAGSGDKIVFGSQLKSVIGEVMPYTLRTESGHEVDAKMGAKSFAARIVRGLIMTGLRSTALDATGEYAVKAYEHKG